MPKKPDIQAPGPGQEAGTCPSCMRDGAELLAELATEALVCPLCGLYGTVAAKRFWVNKSRALPKGECQTRPPPRPEKGVPRGPGTLVPPAGGASKGKWCGWDRGLGQLLAVWLQLSSSFFLHKMALT